jgi:hypothetical protein
LNCLIEDKIVDSDSTIEDENEFSPISAFLETFKDSDFPSFSKNETDNQKFKLFECF